MVSFIRLQAATDGPSSDQSPARRVAQKHLFCTNQTNFRKNRGDSAAGLGVLQTAGLSGSDSTRSDSLRRARLCCDWPQAGTEPVPIGFCLKKREQRFYKTSSEAHRGLNSDPVRPIRTERPRAVRRKRLEKPDPAPVSENVLATFS